MIAVEGLQLWKLEEKSGFGEAPRFNEVSSDVVKGDEGKPRLTAAIDEGKSVLEEAEGGGVIEADTVQHATLNEYAAGEMEIAEGLVDSLGLC